MAQYDVTITNGSGSQALLNGDYNVTYTNVTGYAGLLDPTTFTATDPGSTGNFTIAATGTLTVHVTEEGTAGGTAIMSGSFIRCSADGLTDYGTAKTIAATGNCEFPFVPFVDTTGTDIYIRQTASDGAHNFDTAVITVSMDASTKTLEVANPLPVAQTFTLQDANYSGLTLSGTLTFDGPQA